MRIPASDIPVLDTNLFGESADIRSIWAVREWEPDDGYYVAFSGGKDSVALLDIVKRAGVRYDAHYNDTTIDPPELRRFIREQYPEVEWEKPRKSFWELLTENGVPIRQHRWCCRELKERGGVGRTVLTGVRAAESNSRAAHGMVRYCREPGQNKTVIAPLFHWSDDDVWAYIERRGLSYCSLYDEGWKRLGCVFCPNETKRAAVRARWPKMFEALLHNFRKSWPVWQEWPSWQSGKMHFATAEELLEWWWDGNGSLGDGKEQECFLFDQFGDE